MKTTIKSVIAIIALALLGLKCLTNDGHAVVEATEPGTADQSSEEYFGARFKEGKGVELADQMKKSLNLETVEAKEELLSDEVKLSLQVFSVSPLLQATAPISEELAARLKVGTELRLVGREGTAKLTELTASSFVGDFDGTFEVTAAKQVPVIGDTLDSYLAQTNAESVTVIPASSLLQTIQGTFVYVVNGKHFLRTAVTVGRSANDQIEITDGLYPGDEVVKNPVRQIWYAELQALRGGKACADGH